MINFFIFIVLFLFIYSPYLAMFPVNIIDIMAICSLVYLFFKYCFKGLSIDLYRYGVMISLGLFAIWYCLVVDMMSVNRITSNSHVVLNIRFIFENIIVSVALSKFMQKHQVSLDDFFYMLIGIAVVQTLFSLAMLNFNFKKIVVFHWLYFASQSVVFTNPVVFFSRIFGLGQNYLFGLPFVQGLIIIMGFYMAMLKKSWVAIPSIFGIIVIILNARIGFVPILIFLTLSLAYFLFKLRWIKNATFWFYSVIILLAMIIVPMFIDQGGIVAKNIARSGDIFKLTFQLLIEGHIDHGSTYDDLLSDRFLALPSDSMQVIFGIGEMFNEGGQYHTDIGYIRNILYGGIVYSCLLYAFFSCMFFQLYGFFQKKDGVLGRILIISMALSFFLAQFKGDIFGLNEATRFLVLLFCVCIVIPLKQTVLVKGNGRRGDKKVCDI